jgi:hypothetical protein
MSVGGKVVETIVLPDKVWVNTSDHGDLCAIYVERTAEARSIDIGDSLWWQGRYAYWTPRHGRFRHDPPFRDRAIRRIGFSGVERTA